MQEMSDLEERRGNNNKSGNVSGDKIEGRNAVSEALAAGRTINRIWILKPEGGKRLEPALAKILDAAIKQDTVISRVPRNVLDRMSTTHNHQGVIASVAPHEYADLDDILSKARDETESLSLKDAPSHLIQWWQRPRPEPWNMFLSQGSQTLRRP